MRASGPIVGPEGPYLGHWVWAPDTAPGQVLLTPVIWSRLGKGVGCLVYSFGLPASFFFSLRCIYFWLCWVWVATHRLSPLVVSMGYFLLVMCGLLIAVVSLVAECRLWGLQQLRLMSSRARAEYLWRNGFNCSTARGISPDQGLNPCPVLAGGFFTPEPPGKPWNSQSGPLL